MNNYLLQCHLTFSWERTVSNLLQYIHKYQNLAQANMSLKQNCSSHCGLCCWKLLLLICTLYVAHNVIVMCNNIGFAQATDIFEENYNVKQAVITQKGLNICCRNQWRLFRDQLVYCVLLRS